MTTCIERYRRNCQTWDKRVRLRSQHDAFRYTACDIAATTAYRSPFWRSPLRPRLSGCSQTTSVSLPCRLDLRGCGAIETRQPLGHPCRERTVGRLDRTERGGRHAERRRHVLLFQAVGDSPFVLTPLALREVQQIPGNNPEDASEFLE